MAKELPFILEELSPAEAYVLCKQLDALVGGGGAAAQAAAEQLEALGEEEGSFFPAEVRVRLAERAAEFTAAAAARVVHNVLGLRGLPAPIADLAQLNRRWEPARPEQLEPSPKRRAVAAAAASDT